jgi:methionyl-tRNA synthetase
MTRDIDWGIPVPVEGYPAETKRIYVWFDAVIGYLSAAVEWAANNGEPDAWRNWWQNPDSTHAYFMGKDNIVFHTVIWPSMLIGYGSGGELGAGKADLHLPDEVVASEFLTMEGKQLSTSRSVAIYVRDVLERYDPDPVRYFLTAAGPETQDSDFSWSEFLRRNNDELLANWGNLVNRTLTNTHRNFGQVPTPGELTAEDETALAQIAGGFDTVGRLIEESKFRQALGEAMRLSSVGNQYVDHQAPWTAIKNDRERAATILYVALRIVDSLKVMFTPFLPFSSQKLHELLGYDGWLAGPLEFRDIDEDGQTHTVLTGHYSSWIGRWEPSNLSPGQELREPAPLFRKLDPGIVEEELARLTPA